MRADKYYGRAAHEYEVRRAKKRMWHDEHEALRSLLRAGSVIDVPCGTGRFFPLYREKGLEFTGVDISGDMLAQARARDPGAHTIQAALYDLPGNVPRSITAVCVRLLHWFDRSEMVRAIKCLRQLGREVIVTVGLGLHGYAEYNTTDHDVNEFLNEFEGMMHQRIFLQENAGRNRWYMYRFWKPTWADVVDQFTDRESGTIQRLTDVWSERLGVDPVSMRERPVTCEYWSAPRIRDLVHNMLSHEPGMLTHKRPRQTERPLVVVRRQGKEFMIDGRRRSNVLMDGSNVHQVLVVS